ncbi:MAG: hypothetical protein RMA76_43085 [Deltaproteobacteria bacterium]
MTEADPQSGPGEQDAPEAPPPILGRWRNVYLVLVLQLALLVAGFAVVTWWAS